MRNDPSIDVVIPVYNGEKYITMAITSVMEQTLLPDKLIIIDDGSTDRTPELISGYPRKEVPIEYVKKTNGGLSSARNAGIKRSTGRFIAFLDADDEWFPRKLEEQMNTFRSSSLANLGLVYCDYRLIDENGNELKGYPEFVIDLSLRGMVFDRLFEGNKVAGSGSAALVRRECFETAGLFDETLSAAEDWDMWLRIARHYEFDYVPHPLVRIRRHAGNMQGNERYMRRNLLIFYNKWVDRTEKPGQDKSLLQALRFQISKAIMSPANVMFAFTHLSNRAKAKAIKAILIFFLLDCPRYLLKRFTASREESPGRNRDSDA